MPDTITRTDTVLVRVRESVGEVVVAEILLFSV
jgi:hypothetical protein